MGFKEDAEFARFISLGAVGTVLVARDLRDRFGHRPIELERYAMGNKVWQHKVKRLRVPDLVCTECGRRFESKGKSKLSVELSDSDTPGRAWDAGGLRAADVFAFVRPVLDPAGPWGTPSYFTVVALREAHGYASRGGRKSAAQGSEVSVVWPSWTPNADVEITQIGEQVRYRRGDGAKGNYWQCSRWPRRVAYVRPGQRAVGGQTMVIGVVEPPTDLPCPGRTWDPSLNLGRGDAEDRYVAVKASAVRGDSRTLAALTEVADDPSVDPRLGLEAVGSLARHRPDQWTGRLWEVAADTERSVEYRMEAVFILSETPTEEAARALHDVARRSRGQEDEVRAAAAWGLGQRANPRPDLLLPLTADPSDLVALHALAAMPQLDAEQVTVLTDWLGDDDRRAASAATLLRRNGQVPALVTASRTGGRRRLWALRALGQMPEEEVLAAGRLDPGLLDTLRPLWLVHDDWLGEDDARDGLGALDVQRVRFDPVTLR